MKNEPQLDSTQKASAEQFARQSHKYGKGHILEDTTDVAAVIEPLPRRAGAKALDIAAGAGHTGLYLASAGYDVVLSDLTRAMLDRCREAADARGLKVQLRHHSAEVLPYANDEFDLVTCRVAAHHFSSPESFIAEAARVLRPGGHFLLIDGSVDDDEPIAEQWIHSVEKFRDPSHGRFLTPGQWSALCRRHALEVLQCTLTPFKQPDLQWYFETANTSAENRARVMELISNAPAEAKRVFRLAEEDGKIVWWWPRLALLAQKPFAT